MGTEPQGHQTEPSAHDASRLRRAATRAVTRLGSRRYLVEGRAFATYAVDLDQDPPCTCADQQFHGRGCLHELAARLHDGDGQLIMSLGSMLLAAERSMAEHVREQKKAS